MGQEGIDSVVKSILCLYDEKQFWTVYVGGRLFLFLYMHVRDHMWINMWYVCVNVMCDCGLNDFWNEGFLDITVSFVTFVWMQIELN